MTLMGYAEAQALSEPAAAGSLQVRYVIYATSHFRQEKGKDSLYQLDVMERMQVFNTGNRPVNRILVNLYPNGYSSDSTQLGENLLKKRDLSLYFAPLSQLGRITGLDFSLADDSGRDGRDPGSLQVSDPTVTGTKEQLLITLLHPLRPGDSLVLQTPFILSLPERLIDLGHKNGICYLKDWFIQVTGPAVSEKEAEVHMTVADNASVYLNRHLLASEGMEAAGQRLDERTSYVFTMDPHAELAIAPDSISEKAIAWGREQRPGSGIDISPEAFFDKLLPGPLTGKRPLRPDSLWSDMTRARIGQYTDKRRPVKAAFLFNARQADDYRYVSIAPAIGFNEYDKWMPGILIHNYGLPVTPFNFLLAPLYSTGAHTLSGLGKLSYTGRHAYDKWQISVTGSSYGFNAYSDFSDGAGGTVKGDEMRLVRIVPAIRYKWWPDHNDPDKAWSLAASAYILNKDTWVAGEDQFNIRKTTTTVGELKAGFSSDRVLYPYALNATVQGTDQFLRLSAEGHYFLNYDAKGGGLALRAYAGKFFYMVDKSDQSHYNLENYFFDLSGNSGKEDFTFNDYFVGRNVYRGWMSQQMTTGGGFFKVSTPYQTDPVGLTDNWLAAINLTSDVPEGINPFSVLPFRLPLRVFLDVGTYSDLWSENPVAGRFLYDAGLQVSLFKEAVTIYMPVLYSKIYRDTYKSMNDLGEFAQRLRFSIDLGRLLPKRLYPDLKW